MRNSRRIAFSGALIGALLSFAATPDPTAAPPPARGTPAARIVIGNFTFEPKELNVRVGTVLSWLNEDDAPHTVIGADRGSPIQSPPLDTGERYSVTLTTPGTYAYFCSLHPHMTGTITVQ